MKLKHIIALLLALSLSVCCLGVSAFAAVVYYYSDSIWGDTLLNLADMPYYTGKADQYKFTYGNLDRNYIGDDLLVTYQPTYAFKDKYGTYAVFEQYGLLNHVYSLGSAAKTHKFGAWSITLSTADSDNMRVAISCNGSSVKSFTSFDDGKRYFRYGFTIVTLDSKKYVGLIFVKGSDFDTWTESNWVCISNMYFAQSASSYSSGCFGATNVSGVNEDCMIFFDPTYSGYTIRSETDIPGGESVSSSYYKSKLTCPSCGGHNISYRSSFLQTGVVGVVTQQVGYVFKCRDCGASWRAMFDLDENEKFKEFKDSEEFEPGQILEDSTLPAFTSASDWGVTLPDDTDTTSYLNEVFSALNTYTGAFNSFFSQVFSILPAPVLAVILLGVGLVVVVGIIKAVVG